MMRLPNILTMSRIAIIPVLVALLWIREPETQWAAMVLYALACLTDRLDGYFARNWNQQSLVGRLFDPIADKLLVGACLLLPCAFGSIDGWSVLAAVIILLREILVSGLRENCRRLRFHDLDSGNPGRNARRSRGRCCRLRSATDRGPDRRVRIPAADAVATRTAVR